MFELVQMLLQAKIGKIFKKKSKVEHLTNIL